MKYDAYLQLVESVPFSLDLDGTLPNWEFTVTPKMDAKLQDIVETCGGMNVMLSVGDVHTKRFCSVLLRSFFKVHEEVPRWTFIPRWVKFETAEQSQIEYVSVAQAKSWISHVLNPPSMFIGFIEGEKLC